MPGGDLRYLRYEKDGQVVANFFGDAVDIGVLSLDAADPRFVSRHVYAGTDDDGAVWFRSLEDGSHNAVYYVPVH